MLEKSDAKVLVKHGADHDREDKFIAPHVLEVDKNDAFMEHEIFGPFLPILPMDNFEEALEYVKTHEKPLAS